MNSDISILNRLPPDQLDKFKSVTTEIVIESFLFPADRDYLTARFAFIEKQNHLFLWSAAQAIEKYLKANILLLGVGGIKKTHKLMGMVQSLRAAHPNRLGVDTSIPDGWYELGVGSWPTTSIEDYLLHLENWGAPSIRYDQNGFNVHIQNLVLLDRLVFQLRERLVQEKVNECKDVSEQIKSCFFDFNIPFAPKDYNHPPFIGLTLASMSVSTLKAAIKGIYGHPELYITWAKQNLKMDDDEITKIRNVGISASST